MRPVQIAGIALDAHSGAPLVVLREADEPHRLLPIHIGGQEASAIALAAAGQQPPRPLPYDLMAELVRSLDGRVDTVEVDDLRDGTFFATIRLDGPAGERTVGSRPSDAIALAIRMGAPVFVADEVLDVAGAVPRELDEGGTDAIGPVTIDPDRIDAEIESFRTFLDDIDPSDFDA